MDTIYIDNWLSVEEARAEYPHLFATFRALAGVINEEAAAQAVSIAIGICPSCHERQLGCQCWNDE